MKPLAELLVLCNEFNCILPTSTEINMLLEIGKLRNELKDLEHELSILKGGFYF